MRAALHVLAVVVLLPYMGLAAAFLILGHAISSGSLLGIFDTLLAHAVWIVPWGAIGAAILIVAVAVLGAIPPLHRIGALCVFVLAASSLGVLLFMDSSDIDSGQLLFLLPCIGVLLYGAWGGFAQQQAPACTS